MAVIRTAFAAGRVLVSMDDRAVDQVQRLRRMFCQSLKIRSQTPALAQRVRWFRACATALFCERSPEDHRSV